jgi:hypothetical protein
MRNVYKIFVRTPEGKRWLGRPRCRWEDNIRMDFREIGWQVERPRGGSLITRLLSHRLVLCAEELLILLINFMK